MSTKDRSHYRLERSHAASSTSWDRKPMTGDPVCSETVVDCGWGRLIFAQTFADLERLARCLQEERPGSCLLSASVLGNPVEGKYHAFQDSGAWIRKGLIDWAVQMNYGTRSFDRYLKEIRRAGGRRGFRKSVVVGINCKNDIDDILNQIDTVNRAGSRGYALFSYSFLFDEQHQPTEKGRMLMSKIRPVDSE